MCSKEDCTRDVTNYPGSGLCTPCYKTARYHDTKTAEELARRNTYTKEHTQRIKEEDPEAWKEFVRDRNLRKNFGISADDYDAQDAYQHGLCAICGTEPGVRRLAVDHDHATGEVRGLLCINCNQALGKFKDDIRVMARAIAYVQSGGVWNF